MELWYSGSLECYFKLQGFGGAGCRDLGFDLSAFTLHPYYRGLKNYQCYIGGLLFLTIIIASFAPKPYSNYSGP